MQNALDENNTDSRQQHTLLVFRVGKYHFCTYSRSVVTVINPPGVTTIPMTPDTIAGVINYDGHVTPVWCLRTYFDRPGYNRQHEGEIIIARFLDGVAGFWVDETADTISVKDSDFQSFKGFITDIPVTEFVTHGNKTLLYVDFEELYKKTLKGASRKSKYRANKTKAALTTGLLEQQGNQKKISDIVRELGVQSPQESSWTGMKPGHQKDSPSATGPDTDKTVPAPTIMTAASERNTPVEQTETPVSRRNDSQWRGDEPPSALNQERTLSPLNTEISEPETGGNADTRKLSKPSSHQQANQEFKNGDSAKPVTADGTIVNGKIDEDKAAHEQTGTNSLNKSPDIKVTPKTHISTKKAEQAQQSHQVPSEKNNADKSEDKTTSRGKVHQQDDSRYNQNNKTGTGIEQNGTHVPHTMDNLSASSNARATAYTSASTSINPATGENAISTKITTPVHHTKQDNPERRSSPARNNRVIPAKPETNTKHDNGSPVAGSARPVPPVSSQAGAVPPTVPQYDKRNTYSNPAQDNTPTSRTGGNSQSRPVRKDNNVQPRSNEPTFQHWAVLPVVIVICLVLYLIWPDGKQPAISDKNETANNERQHVSEKTLVESHAETHVETHVEKHVDKNSVDDDLPVEPISEPSEVDAGTIQRSSSVSTDNKNSGSAPITIKQIKNTANKNAVRSKTPGARTENNLQTISEKSITEKSAQATGSAKVPGPAERQIQATVNVSSEKPVTKIPKQRIEVIKNEIIIEETPEPGFGGDHNLSTADKTTDNNVAGNKAEKDNLAIKNSGDITSHRVAVEYEEFTYIVQKGDTLWDIAARHLNDPLKYKLISDLSNIDNPNLIYPGDIVRIRKIVRP